MTKLAVITKTPPTGAGGPQANLIKSAFDQLVWNKGYEVIKEHCLRCPCKGKATGQQSNCRNCGGSGYVFINPTATRMVITSMNVSNQFKEWSEERVGTSQITCLQEEELGFMDRITVLDSKAIFSEVLFLKTMEGADESVSVSESFSDSVPGHSVYYFSTLYDIKQILYLSIFNGTQNKFVPLRYDTDFTYTKNKIKLTPSAAATYIDPFVTEQDVSATIRYQHAVQMHIVDIPRETIQTNVKLGNVSNEEVGVDLPVHAVARRSHYVLDQENYDGTRINNNDHIFDYEDLNPPDTTC